MAFELVLTFWAVTALLIAVPGPDWAFAIASGLRGHVVPATAGIVLGYLGLTVVVSAGVGGLVAAAPVALTVLTVVGGVYLLGLGAMTLARPGSAPAPAPDDCGVRADDADGCHVRSGAATLARGIGVSGLNPKGLLVFVALLPQFTRAGAAWPVGVQTAVLGIVFALTCGVTYVVVGSSAHRLLRARPAAARLVSRVSGVGMLVVGAGLLAERVLV
jgi:threonine/homoserine/homoserine lactone efflux protein